jgi:hypothetical protein
LGLQRARLAARDPAHDKLDRRGWYEWNILFRRYREEELRKKDPAR